MVNRLLKIWKNRYKIFAGIRYSIFKERFVEDVAAYRLAICDKCEHKGDKCEVPGTGPCCGCCGCSLQFKTRSLSAACGLEEIGEKPLWVAVIAQEADVE